MALRAVVFKNSPNLQTLFLAGGLRAVRVSEGGAVGVPCLGVAPYMPRVQGSGPDRARGQSGGGSALLPPPPAFPQSQVAVQLQHGNSGSQWHAAAVLHYLGAEHEDFRKGVAQALGCQPTQEHIETALRAQISGSA